MRSSMRSLHAPRFQSNPRTHQAAWTGSPAQGWSQAACDTRHMSATLGWLARRNKQAGLEPRLITCKRIELQVLRHSKRGSSGAYGLRRASKSLKPNCDSTVSTMSSTPRISLSICSGKQKMCASSCKQARGSDTHAAQLTRLS